MCIYLHINAKECFVKRKHTKTFRNTGTSHLQFTHLVQKKNVCVYMAREREG